MTSEEQAALERELAERLARGDIDGAATATITAYGPEIYSFLVAVHRVEDDAADVFSLFGVAFWRALPTFERQSSFRTFAYAIARRISLRYRRDEARRKKRFDALESSAISAVVENVRSRTATYLRTETRSRLAALRASLPEEDQELLMLRVDRDLPWDELVFVLRGDDEPALTPEAQKRESARLRKRFQLLTAKLKKMARDQGLLGDGD